MTEQQLKDYETIYIIRPNLDDESIDRTINLVEENIKSNGGAIKNTEKKGRKRLAYEVKKMRDGFYVHSTFRAAASSIQALKRMMTLSEDIIKHLIVVQHPEELQAEVQAS